MEEKLRNALAGPEPPPAPGSRRRSAGRGERTERAERAGKELSDRTRRTLACRRPIAATDGKEGDPAFARPPDVRAWAPRAGVEAV
ncbi:hypothetical protein GCM10010363_76280 [Streptomyces omiyaensis]|nr:hypothetical protein GCM10010363_76280 [Streptomyces omiyaensis]